jgi:hypothetical protein
MERSNVMPLFVMREVGGKPQSCLIPPKVLEDMVLHSHFTMPPIQVSLSNKLAIVEAGLHLEGDEGNFISGFPRMLGWQETKITRK